MITVRKKTKLLNKNIVEPVKQQNKEYINNNETYEQQNSPCDMVINQDIDMFKGKKVDFKRV